MLRQSFVTPVLLSNISGAASKIDLYDGDHAASPYNLHEDNKYLQETIPAMDFIKRLIRHIPEKHFKMIRYGGLYARRRETDSNLYPCHPQGEAPELPQLLSMEDCYSNFLRLRSFGML